MALPRASVVQPSTIPSAEPSREGLRIVHVVGRCSPESVNGIEKAVFYLSEAQRALGHSVTVVAARAIVPNPYDTSDPESPPPPATRIGRMVGGLVAAVQGTPRLARHVLAARPDIVHLHSVHVPENVGVAAYLRRLRIPYCVTTHGGLTTGALRNGRIKKAIFRWAFEHAYLNQAAFLHAVTEDERLSMRASGLRPPITTVPNGIDLDSLLAPLNPGALVALAPPLAGRRIFTFVGRLDPYTKGLDLLLLGFARADARGAALVIVGPDWRGSRRKLEKLVAELDLTSRVVFTGAAFGQQKADLLAASDVVVHPSRWEGVSLSVLEGAAVGKPCLLTRPADPGGALAQAGAAISVEPSVEGVAGAVARFAAMTPERLSQMGARGRALIVSRFTWTAAAQTLADAYAEARAHGGRQS